MFFLLILLFILHRHLSPLLPPSPILILILYIEVAEGHGDLSLPISPISL